MTVLPEDCTSPPNLRSAKCCYSCVNCESDIRCGWHCGYWCKIYGDQVSDTSICDEYLSHEENIENGE